MKQRGQSFFFFKSVLCFLCYQWSKCLRVLLGTCGLRTSSEGWKMHHLETIQVEHMLLECGRRIFLDFFSDMVVRSECPSCYGNNSLCQICKNQDRSPFPRKKSSMLWPCVYFNEGFLLYWTSRTLWAIYKPRWVFSCGGCRDRICRYRLCLVRNVDPKILKM